MSSAAELQPITHTSLPAQEAGPPRSIANPAAADRTAVAELDRTANAVVRKATDVGVDIEYLGVEPLRLHPVFYPGESPWVVCPAAQDPLMKAGMPIPARQRAVLDRLVQAGMDFPHLYFAHEIPEGIALPSLTRESTADGGIPIPETDLPRLIVRPESPAKTRKTAERLDNITRLVMRGAAKAAVAAGAVAAAPLLLLDGLDPAVLGAITRPADRGASSPPAAWFLLARWDW